MMWDPNTWTTADVHEHRIYGDDNAQTWCVVDFADYQWAIQWRWHINKPHPTRNGSKQYFVRSQSHGCRPGGPRLYLHVEIMKRTGILQPTPLHRIVDHRDGNEWNCRRSNLVWATPRQNRMNINGQIMAELI